MSLEAYLYGNAGEDIYGVQNVDMNPFQQADNFDDIGSGSNSLLDVQDSCMNENEMENLINRQPYTSIKNEPMNFDNNIQNHNIQNHKEMKMNSREDYMYDDIDSDDDDGFNDENAEDENEESANEDEDSDNNDDDDDDDDDDDEDDDVESNEEEEEDDENNIQEDIPVQKTAEEIIQDNVDNILDAVAKNQIKPEEGNEIQQTDGTAISKPKKTRKRKKNGDDKKKEKKKRKVKPSNLRRNIR